MTDDDDYERLEADIDDLDIEDIYGDEYTQLSNKDKSLVILDAWFNGNPRYRNSADQLRDGLAQYKEGNITPEREVIHFKRGNHTYHVIRNIKTGKFVKWVKG